MCPCVRDMQNRIKRLISYIRSRRKYDLFRDQNQTNNRKSLLVGYAFVYTTKCQTSYIFGLKYFRHMHCCPFAIRKMHVLWCALNYVFRILAFVNKFRYQMMFISICDASQHILHKIKKPWMHYFRFANHLFGISIIWTIAAYFA